MNLLITYTGEAAFLPKRAVQRIEILKGPMSQMAHGASYSFVILFNLPKLVHFWFIRDNLFDVFIPYFG